MRLIFRMNDRLDLGIVFKHGNNYVVEFPRLTYHMKYDTEAELIGIKYSLIADVTDFYGMYAKDPLYAFESFTFKRTIENIESVFDLLFEMLYDYGATKETFMAFEAFVNSKEGIFVKLEKQGNIYSKIAGYVDLTVEFVDEQNDRLINDLNLGRISINGKPIQQEEQ